MNKILAGLGATVGAGGLVAVWAYKPPVAPVVTLKPSASTEASVAPTATPTPSASATPPPTPTPKITATPTPTPTGSKSPTPVPTVAKTPVPTAVPTPSPTPIALYTNGTWTGPVTATAYGNVQIQAVVTGGRISAINFLQMPSGGHSSQVTSAVETTLPTETIQIQSANVNNISGCTQSVNGYKSSLGSALTAAHL